MKTVKEYRKKICLMGEGGVGKTSLIKRFVLDIFDDQYLATLGTKISKKDVSISRPDVDINLTMMIWDIMGQKGFRKLLQEAYFYGADGGMVVCDITRLSTLKELEGWISSVHEVTGQIPLIFLANKSDLMSEAEFGEKELAERAAKYDTSYFLTSARTGERVEDAFMALGEMIL